MMLSTSATCWRPPARRSRKSNGSRKDFDADENLRLALAYLIQIIGEAASRVSLVFQEGHTEVPWSEIIGMRHKIVHDYLGVDYDIVWEVVTADLPVLAGKLERIG